MFADIVNFGPAIKLVPNSGVQFVEYAFNLDALGRLSRRFIERILRGGVLDPTALEPADLQRAYELSQDPALRKAFAGVYAGAIHAYAHARELHAAFARYTGPVFCAWGVHDRYIGVAALRDVVRTYPHATTLVLHKSGHLPMIEEPHALGAALRDFLQI